MKNALDIKVKFENGNAIVFVEGKKKARIPEKEFLEFLEIPRTKEEPLLNENGSIHCFMPRINGQCFRCDCGGNVFHKPDKTKERLYQCNSCGVRYQAE